MAKIYIPNLLEFIYDRFVTRTSEYLFDRLSRAELKKVRSKGRIKAFAEKGSFEDIAIMLSKINVGVAIIIWDKENEKRECVKDILISQLEVDPKDLTRHLIKSKIFATQSIDIIRSLQVVSKSCNSQTWGINRKFLELSKIKSDHFKPRNLVSKFEAEKNLTWYVETMSAMINDLPALLEHHKIEIVHFNILLYLQNAPNGATVDAVNQKLNTPRGFKNMLNKLHQANMIDYSPDKTVISIGVNGLIVIDAIISKLP
jgi:hypothetical protein